MTTREGFQAAAQLIRSIAGKWDAQTPQLADIVQRVQGMQFHGYDPGLFKPAIDAHERVMLKVAGRCTEGQAAFQRISQTLTGIAGAYERADAAAAGRIRPLAVPPPRTR